MTNALLVRYNGGWLERLDSAAIAAAWRVEALLGLGAVQTTEEAYRIADRQLAIYADTREQISVDLEPMADADTPYVGFMVGDTITVPDHTSTPTAERVISITVAEDDNGHITYAPELKDVILTQQERLEQGMKKMSNGTMRGDSKVAQPVAYAGVPGASCCPPTTPGGG